MTTPRETWQRAYRAERSARADQQAVSVDLDWLTKAADQRSRYERHEMLLGTLLRARTTRQRIIIRRKIAQA